MAQQPPSGWGPPPQQPPPQGPPTQPGWGPPPPEPPTAKKPWYKRPLPVIGAIVVALLVLGALFGDNDTSPTGQPSATTVAEPEPTESQATEPEPTESPTTAPPAVPPAQTISGRGKTATKSFTIAGGMAVFRFQHQGESNFIVDLLTRRGEDVDNLVNEIGSINGATAQGLDEGRYLFNVEADGPWSIRIEQPRPGSGRGLPATANGRGHGVAGPFQGRGTGVRFALRHRGESNFIVDVLDAEGGEIGNLSNEIGSFQGSIVGEVPEGVFWLNVQADGLWTVAMRPL